MFFLTLLLGEGTGLGVGLGVEVGEPVGTREPPTTMGPGLGEVVVTARGGLLMRVGEGEGEGMETGGGGGEGEGGGDLDAGSVMVIPAPVRYWVMLQQGAM